MLPSEFDVYDGRDDRAQSATVMGGPVLAPATPSPTRIDRGRERRIGGAR
jgi:hypothetical protein